MATPNAHTHYNFALKARINDKHVLFEKPMVSDSRSNNAY
ncbi:MAG: Gfo/Idh/MocA family oxidoreductase [Ignavibacteria bacterium]